MNKVKVAFVFIYLFIFAYAAMGIKRKPMHLLSKHAVLVLFEIYLLCDTFWEVVNTYLAYQIGNQLKTNVRTILKPIFLIKAFIRIAYNSKG